MTRVALFSLLSVFVCTASQLHRLPVGHADSVHLKNGSVIHGAANDQRAQGGPVRVDFAGKGFVILGGDQVARIEKNERDEFVEHERDPSASARSDAVLVTLKRGSSYYGQGSYFGWPASADDDPILVLNLPGGGTLRLPRADIQTIETVELKEEAPPVEPGGVIETTHVVHLKNGREIQGNLVETAAAEPLQIRVGALGLLSFPRDEVERVEEKAGSYKLPEPPAAVEKPVPGPLTPEALEELKARLRQEILEELLDALIGEQVDRRVGDLLREGSLGAVTPAEAVDAETLMDIQFQVRELGRQRTRERVRAEATLKRLGPVVIPFLNSAAVHPFGLTRRAVQRIISDVGDVRGVPLAIDGLNDPDFFVRQLAHRALTKLLGNDVPYHPRAAEKTRLAAQKRYREIWLERQREYVREVVRTGKTEE